MMYKILKTKELSFELLSTSWSDCLHKRWRKDFSKSINTRIRNDFSLHFCHYSNILNLIIGTESIMMMVILNKSIKDLLYNLRWTYLITIVGPITTVKKSHHFKPVNYCGLLLKEFPSKVFFPILQPFQFIGEHFRVNWFPLVLNLSQFSL